MKTVNLSIDIPPSVNRVWRSVRGKVIKSADYKNWLNMAGWQIQAQRPGKIDGAYTLHVTFPECMRGDLDNRVKAISDILQKQGVIENDSYAFEIHLMRRDSVPDGKCYVYLHQFESVIRATGDGAAGGSALVRGRGPLVREVAR